MSISIQDILKSDRNFVIAEVGSNHNGCFESALKLTEEAAEAGASAIKFQIYRVERKVLKSMPAFPSVSHIAKTQYERWKSLEFSNEQWKTLSQLASDKGLCFIATVCDEQTVDELDPCIAVYKIASGDATNPKLIEHIAAKGKPVIMSTGMSNINELDKTVSLIPKERLILLHCITSYPTSSHDANLINIKALRERYGIVVGYSDHTIGQIAPIVATAMGAPVIEKHFTLNKTQPFGDHLLSLEPQEFKEMIEKIKIAKSMIGKPRREVYECEKDFREIRQRGLYASENIPAGTLIEESMLIPLIPRNNSLSAVHFKEVIGKIARSDIKKGDPILPDTIIS